MLRAGLKFIVWFTTISLVIADDLLMQSESTCVFDSCGKLNVQVMKKG